MRSITTGVQRISLTALLAAGLSLAACDNSTPPPPNTTNTGGGGGGGNPVDRLAENPNSLLGKSAARGRDVARQVSSAQDAAVGTAQELSGEAEGFSVAGLHWSVPTNWRKVTPSSNMRAAELRVDGSAGEANVAFFTNVGGDADSNINRWRSQFYDTPPADISTRTIAGSKVRLVTIRGTAKGGQPGGPAEDQANYGLRGAIVDGPQGMIFIKFQGPEDTLAENEAAWKTMINGMRRP